MNDKITISMLVAARKNSKYLAKFLISATNRTLDRGHTEILVMMNEQDTWNEDIVDYFEPEGIRFFHEDLNLGRAGLHEYFNLLVPYARGDWIIYFCEDHYIVMKGWDNYLRQMITGELTVQTEVGKVKRHEFGHLDPEEPWCIVPSFDNAGPMNHVLSRGFIEALGGSLARHGNLDSYINAVAGRTRQRLLQFDTEPAMFHDFTHDEPNPMSDAAMQSVISDEGRKLPKFESVEIQELIDQDVKRLHDALEEYGE